MKIALGCDHGGYEIKEAIKKHLSAKGIQVNDFGTYSAESVDYPIYANKVCKAVLSGEFTYGILCCGTGIGISIAANKIKGIRAAAVSDAFSTEMTRRHNDANVLCLGGRVLSVEKALELTDIFISTEFDGMHHTKRLEMIKKLENGEEL